MRQSLLWVISYHPCVISHNVFEIFRETNHCFYCVISSAFLISIHWCHNPLPFASLRSLPLSEASHQQQRQPEKVKKAAKGKVAGLATPQPASSGAKATHLPWPQHSPRQRARRRGVRAMHANQSAWIGGLSCKVTTDSNTSGERALRYSPTAQRKKPTHASATFLDLWHIKV